MRRVREASNFQSGYKLIADNPQPTKAVSNLISSANALIKCKAIKQVRDEKCCVVEFNLGDSRI